MKSENKLLLILFAYIAQFIASIFYAFTSDISWLICNITHIVLYQLSVDALNQMRADELTKD